MYPTHSGHVKPRSGGVYGPWGAVAALSCPEPGCRAPIPPAVLRALLPADQFQRWERLNLEKALNAMADLVYCPRCEAAVLEDEAGDHCGQCTACMYVFCSLCREGWHPGTTCLSPERRLEVRRCTFTPASPQLDPSLTPA